MFCWVEFGPNLILRGAGVGFQRHCTAHSCTPFPLNFHLLTLVWSALWAHCLFESIFQSFPHRPCQFKAVHPEPDQRQLFVGINHLSYCQPIQWLVFTSTMQCMHDLIWLIIFIMMSQNMPLLPRSPKSELLSFSIPGYGRCWSVASDWKKGHLHSQI